MRRRKKMLPTLKIREMTFESPRAALDYLEDIVVQRFTVPAQTLRVQHQGTLSHASTAPIAELREIPLTDVALGHLDSIAGIPRAYARRIEPVLHAYNLNARLAEQVAGMTVVVEFSRKEPEDRRVSAIVPGARFGVDDQLVLRRLETRGLSACVSLGAGWLDVRFGDTDVIEVLPKDAVQLAGRLRSVHWGRTLSTRPSLEVAVHLLRLICKNGAYIGRTLAEARLLTWASRPQIERFLDEQVERVLNFPRRALQEAAGRMAESIPEEPERERITRLVARQTSQAIADEVLKNATSWWDWINGITQAANRVSAPERRRRLQLEGGALIERFL
jgi:hypothetical protein